MVCVFPLASTHIKSIIHGFLYDEYSPSFSFPCQCVCVCLPHVTVNPQGVAAVTQGVDGGPGLSGLVVHTNTSLGLLFPSMFDAMSYREGGQENKRREGRECEVGGKRRRRRGQEDGIQMKERRTKCRKRGEKMSNGAVVDKKIHSERTWRNLSGGAVSVLINRNHYSLLFHLSFICLHFSLRYLIQWTICFVPKCSRRMNIRKITEFGCVRVRACVHVCTVHVGHHNRH